MKSIILYTSIVLKVLTTLHLVQAQTTDLSCPETLEIRDKFDDKTTLYYSVVPSNPPESNNGIFCGRLEVTEHDGWVGFAISDTGTMSGSLAIIGIPEEDTVQKYNLFSYGANLSDQQTLMGTSVDRVDGTTIMEFTKLLVEDGEPSVKEEGMTNVLLARGGSELGFHTKKIGSFIFLKAPSPPEDEEPSLPDEDPSTTVLPTDAPLTSTSTSTSSVLTQGQADTPPSSDEVVDMDTPPSVDDSDKEDEDDMEDEDTPPSFDEEDDMEEEFYDRTTSTEATTVVSTDEDVDMDTPPSTDEDVDMDTPPSFDEEDDMEEEETPWMEDTPPSNDSSTVSSPAEATTSVASTTESTSASSSIAITESSTSESTLEEEDSASTEATVEVVSAQVAESTDLSCPDTLDMSTVIDASAKLYYAMLPSNPPGSNNGILCGRLEVDNDGWIGFAVSEEGNMPGSLAIIGIPEEDTVQMYDLFEYGANLSSRQTLRDTSIDQVDGKTIMEFTKLLFENKKRVAIVEAGKNNFLYAKGGSTLGYHTGRQSFTLDLGVEPFQTIVPTRNPSLPPDSSNEEPTGDVQIISISPTPPTTDQVFDVDTPPSTDETIDSDTPPSSDEVVDMDTPPSTDEVVDMDTPPSSDEVVDMDTPPSTDETTFPSSDEVVDMDTPPSFDDTTTSTEATTATTSAASTTTAEVTTTTTSSSDVLSFDGDFPTFAPNSSPSSVVADATSFTTDEDRSSASFVRSILLSVAVASMAMFVMF